MSTEEREHIYVKDDDCFYEKVYLEDIYYIETIKSTHYCRVVHKSGEGKIHADITPLEKKLEGYLFKTKSSTLINPALVWKIHTGKRHIYFSEDIYCTYALKMSRKLKEKLQIIV